MSVLAGAAQQQTLGGGGSSYSDRIISLSPYWYLPLDETSGSTAADASGNGRDGTYTGVTTYDAGALNNEGSSVVLAAAYSSRVSFVSPSINLAAMTLEMWISSTDTGTDAHLLTSDSTTGSQRHWIWRSDNVDRMEFVKIPDGVVTVSASVTTSVLDGDPHHIAVTYDGSDLTMYLDGVLNGTKAATGNITGTSTNTPTLSGSGRSSAAGVQGNYAHVALYEYALSATQVADNYAAGI